MWIYGILISLFHLFGIPGNNNSSHSGSMATVHSIVFSYPLASSDTMTILLSKTNHYYYYQGMLENDASNFKSGSLKSIKDAAEMYYHSGSPGKFIIVIKTDRKPRLNDDTKEVVSFLQQKYHCVNSYFTAEETQLIGIVEKNLAD